MFRLHACNFLKGILEQMQEGLAKTQAGVLENT